MSEKCPLDVETQLLVILELGLLKIRRNIDRESYTVCAAESNHLHNIPGMIRSFSIDRLSFYLDVEVAQYIRETPEPALPEMEGAWETLRGWVEHHRLLQKK
jgi:hypothetical protein